MGPSGTGKTLIAVGLCHDAVKAGYKAYFKTKDVVKSQQTEFRKLLKAKLPVLDDIILFPLEKNMAVACFNFVNHIYKST